MPTNGSTCNPSSALVACENYRGCVNWTTCNPSHVVLKLCWFTFPSDSFVNNEWQKNFNHCHFSFPRWSSIHLGDIADHVCILFFNSFLLHRVLTMGTISHIYEKIHFLLSLEFLDHDMCPWSLRIILLFLFNICYSTLVFNFRN